MQRVSSTITAQNAFARKTSMALEWRNDNLNFTCGLYISNIGPVYFQHSFFLSSELGTMAKRKRTGGIQQRIAQANAEVRVETCGNESQLAQFLLERFAWGEMSPQLLQRISHLAVQEGVRWSTRFGIHWYKWHLPKQVSCWPDGKSWKN